MEKQVYINSHPISVRLEFIACRVRRLTKSATLPILLMLACAIARAGGIEFAGYVHTSSGMFFAFSDPPSHRSSPWLTVGEEWQGYRILAFDSASEELMLRKGEEQKKLRLHNPSPKDSVVLPSFAKGEFILADGTIVYSSAATLRVGTFDIRSPSGVMVSDRNRQNISGDLTIQTPEGIFNVGEASVRLVNGKPVITAKTLNLTPIKKSPADRTTPAPEPAPTTTSSSTDRPSRQ